ncbi:hypothetical protein V8C37DRAFT_35071 [Trichoderma ceciliae]
MSSTSNAELGIYAALSIPTIFVLIKHGRTGILGWLYLFAFCTLRIIGGAMSLSGSASANIISSVGLSPLLLATSGILHEARIYTCRDTLNNKKEWGFVLLFHLVVTSGIAILATGASKLQSSHPEPIDGSLVKAGIALLTLSWVLVVAASLWTLAHLRKSVKQTPASAGIKLLWSALFSEIFTGIRVIYALVQFVKPNASLSLNGPLAVRVVLTLLPELISVLAFLTAGILTRNIAQEAEKEKMAVGRNENQS